MPEVYCEFSSSRAPIEKDMVRMYINGEDVTARATVSAWRISWTPSAPLEPGDYDVLVVVVDHIGSRGEKSWTFTVDPDAKETGKPILHMVFPGDGQLLSENDDIIISADVLESGAGGIDTENTVVTIIKDGATFPFQKNTLTIDKGKLSLPLGNLETGKYFVEISVADLHGNRSPKVKSSFIVDGVPPRIDSFSVSPERIDVTGRIIVAAEVVEIPDGKAARCTLGVFLDGKLKYQKDAYSEDAHVLMSIGALELSNGEGGSYELGLECVDGAGNISYADARPIVFVDIDNGYETELLSQMPGTDSRRREDIFVDPFGARYTNEGYVDVSGSALPDSEVTVLVNGADQGFGFVEADKSFDFKTVLLEEGLNLVSVQVTDENGAITGITNEEWIVLDTYPPEIIERLPADGSYLYEGPPVISIVAEDPEPAGVSSGINVSAATLRIDGSTAGNATSRGGNVISFSVPALGPGMHDVEVELTDRAGNRTRDYWWFEIEEEPDISEPDIDEPIIPPVVYNLTATITYEPSISVSGKSTGGAEVILLLDGIEQFHELADSSGEFVFAYVLLEEGENVISVQATSALGTYLGESNVRTIILDTISPVITDRSPADGGSFLSEDLEFYIYASDPEPAGYASGLNISVAKMLVDGMDLGSGHAQGDKIVFDSPGTLEAGTHDINIELIDNAGNLTSDSWWFEVQEEPVIPAEPSLFIVEPGINEVLGFTDFRLYAEFSGVELAGNNPFKITLDGRPVGRNDCIVTEESVSCDLSADPGQHTIELSMRVKGGKNLFETREFSIQE